MLTQPLISIVLDLGNTILVGSVSLAIIPLVNLNNRVPRNKKGAVDVISSLDPWGQGKDFTDLERKRHCQVTLAFSKLPASKQVKYRNYTLMRKMTLISKAFCNCFYVSEVCSLIQWKNFTGVFPIVSMPKDNCEQQFQQPSSCKDRLIFKIYLEWRSGSSNQESRQTRK